MNLFAFFVGSNGLPSGETTSIGSRTFLFTLFTVSQTDKQPVFLEGDRVLADRWAYGFRVTDCKETSKKEYEASVSLSIQKTPIGIKPVLKVAPKNFRQIQADKKGMGI